MGTIQATDYNIEEQRLMETEAIKDLAADILSGIRSGHVEDFDPEKPSFVWMQIINSEYYKCTGDCGKHIGACARAVGNLIIEDLK